MTGTVHIVGAGLAGLAAGVELTDKGVDVVVYEAAGHAGGRCRSLYDRTLGAMIDNGNHLIMAGNRATFRYLEAIGASDRFTTVAPARFPFLDLETGERWTVRPNQGPIPWWMFSPSGRIPGTKAVDYLRAARLPIAHRHATVAEVLGAARTLYKRLWEPLATAALNTDPSEAAARLLWPVVAETFLRGEAFCRPYVATDGLSHALIDPALAKIGAGRVRFGHRLRGLDRDGARVTGLAFGRDDVALGSQDSLVLALPPAATKALLPDIEVPGESRTIVNAHFRLDHAPLLPDQSPLMGLIGGVAQWLFVRGRMVSVTVSAADSLAAQTSETIATVLWRDVARALALDESRPSPSRVINERRATIAQTPVENQRRPSSETRFANLFLAGDWIDTGLPATIESAVRAGQHAAALAQTYRRPLAVGLARREILPVADNAAAADRGPKKAIH